MKSRKVQRHGKGIVIGSKCSRVLLCRRLPRHWEARLCRGISTIVRHHCQIPTPITRLASVSHSVTSEKQLHGILSTLGGPLYKSSLRGETTPLRRRVYEAQQYQTKRPLQIWLPSHLYHQGEGNTTSSSHSHLPCCTLGPAMSSTMDHIHPWAMGSRRQFQHLKVARVRTSFLPGPMIFQMSSKMP